jgi:dipeptidyl aminopeptidase/acylaminoacyl peptidase
MPDSSAVLLTGRQPVPPQPSVAFEAPVAPLSPSPDDAVFRLPRLATSVSPSPFGDGARVVAVSSEGEIAYVDGEGRLWLADLPNTAPARPALRGIEVHAAGFAPDGRPLVLELSDGGEGATIELFDAVGEDRQVIAIEGTMPRWQP